MKRAFTIIGILFLLLNGVAQNGSRFSSDLRFNEISINGSTTPELHSGDTIVFTISIENIGSEPYRDCTLSICTTSPYIVLIDSTEYFDYIAPGNEYTFNRCLIAVIAPNIPDGNSILFTFSISNSAEDVVTQRSYLISNGNIEVDSYEIIAHSHTQRSLRSSESGSLIFRLTNNGSHNISNADISIISVSDPNITITGNMHGCQISSGETIEFPTTYQTNAQFQSERTLDVSIGYNNGNDDPQELIASIIGSFNCEDFDSGQIPANLYGEGTQVGWQIDTTVSSIGNYSIRSGQISHYDSSTVNLSISVPQSTYISFYIKVSSESNYDWLYFYIDGEQQSRWSGTYDWTHVTFPLAAGTHILTWRYIKDKSVNTGSDCAWIDEICLPQYLFEEPTLTITPDTVEMTIVRNETELETVNLDFCNSSDIYLVYENSISDATGTPIAWLNISSKNGSINAGGHKDIAIEAYDLGMIPGDYQAFLRTTIHDIDTTLITPIILHILSGVSIEEHPEPTCHVYPNPTNGEITIDNEYAIIKEISIYDIFGKLVLKEEANSYSHHIRISDYASGVYLMKIITDDNTIETLKIIKR